MEIPNGYKQTGVGVIPNDWQVKKIREVGGLLSDTVNPQNFPVDNFYEYSMPSFDEGKKPIYTQGKTMHSNRIAISAPVLLFNKLNVRQRRIWLVKQCEQNSVCSMEFLPFVSHNINLDYLRHVVDSDKVTNFFISSSRGTSNSQKRIAPSDFLDLYIPIPPIAEQKAIAQKLSEIDELTAGLGEQIEKKRQIKEGAMQQLLTGKTRLPGFNQPWSTDSLGNHAEIYRGGSPRPIENYLTDSPNGINWIKIGDVSTNAKYIESTQEKIVTEGIRHSREVHAGDFLLSNSMSFGRPYILKVDGCIHDGWLVIQNYQESFESEYLYYILGSSQITHQYLAMAAGSSVLNLNKDIVKKVLVPIPPIDEQSAIAQVLSDMDDEIHQLEAEHNKYSLIKQGMMQELLTGNTRLV